MAAVELRCDHVSTTDGTVLSHPSTVPTVRARRGTAAAATGRALLCTRGTPPGMDTPPPRRAPWRGRRGRAAAWRGVLGTSRRARATLRTRSAGRIGPSGAAAGRPAARAPWAPAADPSSGPSLAAGFSARLRHCSQPSRLGLEGVFSFFLVSLGDHSKTKLKPKKENNLNKTSIQMIQFATPTYDCSLVAFDMLIESRFECSPAGLIESWHGGNLETADPRSCSGGGILSEVV